jgi:hypothetical protein
MGFSLINFLLNSYFLTVTSYLQRFFLNDICSKIIILIKINIFLKIPIHFINKIKKNKIKESKINSRLLFRFRTITLAGKFLKLISLSINFKYIICLKTEYFYKSYDFIIFSIRLLRIVAY